MGKNIAAALFLTSFVILSMSQATVSVSPEWLESHVSLALSHKVARKKTGAEVECPGIKFYTRKALLEAMKSFPEIKEATGRDIAAFSAHFAYETGGLCYIEEVNGTSRDYCKSSIMYPCQPWKKYYGRGPLQMKWNYNYGAVGRALHLNLLSYPELVAQDPVISFRSALQYWISMVQPALDEHGFGATIRIINANDCDGKNPEAVQARIRLFEGYCGWYGASPGKNLGC